MRDSNYTIRPMNRNEVDVAIEWAAAEGWNPGLYDADCFYSADNNGFLVGLLGDKPVATISAIKYGNSFGFLGFYIVEPEYRGKSYGIQIWNAGLSYLNGRTIGLDGVIAQQDNYKKSGFTLAYRNIRYQGIGDGYIPDDTGIVPLSTIPFDDICAFDKPFFADNRIQFLKCWINQPQSLALGIVKNGKLAGYGVIRICRDGFKIGPLFADEPEYAEQLLLNLKAHVPKDTAFFLDIPAVNPAAVDLVKRHNMNSVFETARMYSGKCPEFPLERLFGITTFELG